MKKIIFLIIFLALIPLALALDECYDITPANTDCEVITPVISCSTYDLYAPNHTLMTDDGTMTQIGSSNIYNFTFNKATDGNWIIHLCSNHTGVITVDSNNDTFIGVDVWTYKNRNVNLTSAASANVSVNETAIAEEVWNYNISTITEDENTAAGFVRLTHTIVEWIERLLG